MKDWRFLVLVVNVEGAAALRMGIPHMLADPRRHEQFGEPKRSMDWTYHFYPHAVPSLLDDVKKQIAEFAFAADAADEEHKDDFTY